MSAHIDTVVWVGLGLGLAYLLWPLLGHHRVAPAQGAHVEHAQRLQPTRLYAVPKFASRDWLPPALLPAFLRLWGSGGLRLLVIVSDYWGAVLLFRVLHHIERGGAAVFVCKVRVRVSCV